MNPVCELLIQKGLRVVPVTQNGKPLALTWDPAQLGPLFDKRVVVVLPDIHLSNDGAGDIFREGDAARHPRFRGFLEALKYAKGQLEQRQRPLSTLHLGDLYDVWRAYPDFRDHPTMDYRAIELAYSDVIDLLVRDLDGRVCLGNHDASMGLYPPWWARNEQGHPNGRLAYAQSTANGRVLAFHGHQADRINAVMSSQDGASAVKAITWVAKNISNPLGLFFEQRVDILQDVFADQALSDNHVENNGLWAPSATLADEAGFHSDLWCDRINQEHVRTVIEHSSHLDSLRILFVGHSHRAGISAIHVTDERRFIPVVDFGSWAWGRTQFGVAVDGEVSLWSLA